MLAIPLLIFGIILFLAGKDVARILAFPVGFLVFMIPVGALQQTSFRLQFLITGAMQLLCPLIGIKINAVGTTLSEVSGAWGFDIAEGCSGIRSLVAIIMLTAIYAHIFEKTWWKKLVVWRALSVLPLSLILDVSLQLFLSRGWAIQSLLGAFTTNIPALFHFQSRLARCFFVTNYSIQDRDDPL
jgi:exosortase